MASSDNNESEDTSDINCVNSALKEKRLEKRAKQRNRKVFCDNENNGDNNSIAVSVNTSSCASCSCNENACESNDPDICLAALDF